MAKFEITEGKPGQGKSLYTARKARELVYRNIKFYKKKGKVREIYSNMKFSTEFEEEATIYHCTTLDGQEKIYSSKEFHKLEQTPLVNEIIPLIKYWDKVAQVTNLYDVDLIWDEIATELDSRNFANLTEELKRFLSQYRKRGVDIYANTQDWSMIDMRARLMLTNVYTLKKIIGSPDPSPTKPDVKKIWGIVLVREVQNILADDPHDKKYNLIPGMFFIEKDDIDIYDTRQDIPQSPPEPVKHKIIYCEHHDDPNHECTYKRVVHK